MCVLGEGNFSPCKIKQRLTDGDRDRQTETERDCVLGQRVVKLGMGECIHLTDKKSKGQTAII